MRKILFYSLHGISYAIGIIGVGFALVSDAIFDASDYLHDTALDFE